jgi:PPK2 family polyphosphate:nucleotide phosphotransferase
MQPLDITVTPGAGALSLADYDPASKAGMESKRQARKLLRRNVEKLCKLQDTFASQSSHAVLIVLQGMDAAGKDGIIKHVMTGLNPQGVNVFGFRAPSLEESRHDFLWRESKVLPERGRIAIFNRSYYEEVLVVRVHPEILASQGVTDPGPDPWTSRYEDINAFERHLTRCGTTILKFCLHISKEEQRERLLRRLQTPDKMWKASDADLIGHSEWDSYVTAYEAMLANTSTEWAPWHIIPADRKWVSRSVVGSVLTQTLKGLGLKYPEPPPDRLATYAKLAEQLKAEAPTGLTPP